MALSIRSIFMIRIRFVWAHLILLFNGLQLCFSSKLHALRANLLAFISYLGRMLVQRKNLGWIQLSYFLFESILGFLLLRSLNPTTRPKTDLDLFFMSASAATDSSMLTVEMEAFSHPQLLVLALMMLLSSEVFTSLLDLQLLKCELDRMREKSNMKTAAVDIKSSSIDHVDDGNSTRSQIELVIVELPNSVCFKSSPGIQAEDQVSNKAPRVLSHVILGYLLLSHLLGSVSIFAYLSLVPSAREVIKSKGFDRALPFSIFMTISSFANAGFSPLNENMMPFKRNPGMLSIFIPLLLVGNTLFPVCLRLAIGMLKSFTKRGEFDHLLENSEKIGFHHLHSRPSSIMLFITVLGLVTAQAAFFCFMEWNSKSLDGLNSYQKLVGSLFQSVDVRHAGESLFDLSLLSPAILVSYVVMMYLPPYTSFMPMEEERSSTPTVITKEKKSQGLVKSLLVSQLAYLAISIILICITEREKLTRDPLNFNVLNITIEVISAFGNVGFSTGYSCDRQLKPDKNCKAQWYGFVGTWSSQGKFILIAVMFFGKLKKFSRKSGKAWKLN